VRVKEELLVCAHNVVKQHMRNESIMGGGLREKIKKRYKR